MVLRGIQGYSAEMLTILPESKTRAILLASKAIYSCIPPKRAIQYHYYYYYLYRALCVILLSYDHEWLSAAIFGLQIARVQAYVEWSTSGTIQVTYYCLAIILLPSLSQSPGNNNVTKCMEYTIVFWPPKALYG